MASAYFVGSGGGPAAVKVSRTRPDPGPDIRTTATPAGPAFPVDRAKIVSSLEAELGSKDGFPLALCEWRPVSGDGDDTGGFAGVVGCVRSLPSVAGYLAAVLGVLLVRCRNDVFGRLENLSSLLLASWWNANAIYGDVGPFRRTARRTDGHSRNEEQAVDIIVPVVTLSPTG